MTQTLLHRFPQAIASCSGIALTTFLVALPAPSYAFVLNLVSDRAALGGNDQVNWATLGPVTPPLPFKILPNSIAATSQAGLNLTVTIPPATSPGITPLLLFQTTATGTPTNFASGDFVLFTGLLPGQFPSPGNPGPITISFDTPVAGAGAQIAVDDTTQFIASIAAFDSSHQLLGTFSVPGTSSLALDNSAIFLGVLSDTPNISQVVFSSSISDRALGINTLSINSTAVPEPGSVLALSLAGVGLLAARKRKTV